MLSAFDSEEVTDIDLKSRIQNACDSVSVTGGTSNLGCIALVQYADFQSNIVYKLPPLASQNGDCPRSVGTVSEAACKCGAPTASREL